MSLSDYLAAYQKSPIVSSYPSTFCRFCLRPKYEDDGITIFGRHYDEEIPACWPCYKSVMEAKKYRVLTDLALRYMQDRGDPVRHTP